MAQSELHSFGKSVYVNLPKIFFIMQVFIGLWLSFWILFNHEPNTGDDVEHLHSAWLVFQGKIPYIDFFQHHNPLLWYVFAPLVGHFAYDLIIFDIVRIISTLVMFLTLLTSAAIVKKFICKNWYAGLLTVASVFPSYVIYSGQDFRPDNYMVFSFIVGLYYFFDYLECCQLRQLVKSFLCMTLCFLFMQKSIFFLSFFACIVLYEVYTRHITLAHFYKAMILPVIIGGLFLGWLLYYGMVEKYWLSNYIFNLYIPDVYGGMVERTRAEFYVLTAIAGAGFIWFFYHGNVFSRIIALLWLSEAIQRFFYFSLDRHYYYFLSVLNAMLAGAVIYELIKRWNWTAYIFVVLSLWGGIIFSRYCQERKINYFRYVTPQYVLENTNRCDAVLNGYGLTYGIFSKDITYYWNLNGQLDVIGNKIGLAPLPDINSAVAKYLPRIVYSGPFWNEKLRKQNIDMPVHWLDTEIREHYYDQSAFVNIHILKPEYQEGRRCRYNIGSDTWEYYYKEQ